MTHSKNLDKNYYDSKKIVQALNNISYKNIIIEDYESKKYFRRYSNKFSNLNNMISYNISNPIKPNIILSSKVKSPLNDQDIIILLNNNKIIISSHLTIKKPLTVDDNSIRILNANFGYDYHHNKMKYKVAN